MPAEELETEELIKETAKRIFFQKGHLKATTQEIADEAGINRAMIHYYFRSRDLLFDKVFKEAMTKTMNKLWEVLSSDEPFRVKIYSFLDTFISQAVDYPYLENFIITEIATDPERIECFGFKDKKKALIQLNKQLQQEIKKGGLAPITIEHFMVNMMSLCNYPLISKPLIQNLFSITDSGYKKFLLERKEIVYRLIFNKNPPK